ncbi:Uncharacterised protein [Photobacterium damselae]|nr:Uncharacterised protein [Photobacterium damselae]
MTLQCSQAFVVLTAHFAGTASEHFFYTLYLIGGDAITTMREIFSQVTYLLKMSLVDLGTCISAVSKA